MSVIVMSSTIDRSATESRALRGTRKSKPTSFTAFFDTEPDDEPWSEHSSPMESEKEEDRAFISHDELEGSEDEYHPRDDSGEDDDHSIGSSSEYSDTDSSDEDQSKDTGNQYDHSDSSDEDLSKIPPTPIRVVSDASAAKKNKIAGLGPKLLSSVGSTQPHRRAVSKANR
jgi:hypothetical protein